MTEHKTRWAIANKMFFIIIGLIALFGVLDNIQVQVFHELESSEAWDLYNQKTQPVLITLWIVILLLLPLAYGMIFKDWSEALGVATAGIIMLFTGLEDVFFFLLRGQLPYKTMCWFNEVRAPVAKISEWFGFECVGRWSLIITSVVGIGIAYLVYWLLRQFKIKK